MQFSKKFTIIEVYTTGDVGNVLKSHFISLNLDFWFSLLL
jgi:hypothetical protein